jgi:hypothetical protein
VTPDEREAARVAAVRKYLLLLGWPLGVEEEQ